MSDHKCGESVFEMPYGWHCLFCRTRVDDISGSALRIYFNGIVEADEVHYHEREQLEELGNRFHEAFGRWPHE